jgi:hypothetical protein
VRTSSLEILDVRRTRARSAPKVTGASYRVPVPDERRAGLSDRVAALLAAPDCWIERTRPHHRRFDLRPLLAGLRLLPDALEIDLLVTPQGAARPEEVLEVLGLGDLPAAGAVVERTRLEITDEDSQPDTPAGQAPGNRPGDGVPAGTDTAPPAVGVCPPGAADSQEGIA